MFSKIRARRTAEVYATLRKMVVETKKWETAYFSDSPYVRLTGGQMLGYEADFRDYNYWDYFEERSNRRLQKHPEFSTAVWRYEALVTANTPRTSSSTDIYPIFVYPSV